MTSAARISRWGARAEDWAASEAQQVPTYEEALRAVPVDRGDRVLDVACGSGVFLSLAAGRGAQTSGIDASDALLALARAREPRAELVVGDMQSLPWDDDSFDLVTGFNSFFFADDMVAALREAGRVAKPGAAVLVQVWGAPERCDLTVMKRALGQFLPPREPPPPLWKPGVLEGIAANAGLVPERSFDTAWAFEYADDEALARAMLAPAPAVDAVANAGEQAVRGAILEALAPYRTPGGGYRLSNEWHFLVARA